MSATRWPDFTPNASITSPGLCHSSRLRARSDSCDEVRTAEAIENDAAPAPIKKTTTKSILCDLIFKASLRSDLNRCVPASRYEWRPHFGASFVANGGELWRINAEATAAVK